MLRIEKGAAPGCLRGLERERRRVERASGKETEAKDWAPGDCAQPIRDALHRDQYGLCGYCMLPIEAIGHSKHPEPLGNGGMRIEHLTTRKAAPARMYEWRNLLGVCGGRSGAPGGETVDHCDRTRGDLDLTLDPHRAPNVETTVSFSRKAPPGHEDDGQSLWVHAPEAHRGSIDALNLNNAVLRRRRREVQADIARRLGQAQRKGGLPRVRRLLQTIERAATEPDPNGRLPAFARVARDYARAKLRAQP